MDSPFETGSRLTAAYGSSQRWDVRSVDEFTIRIAPTGSSPQLYHNMAAVMPITARRMEAQFRFPDGSTLILASDDTPFVEALTVLYLAPDLRLRDQLVIGGAYTPGFLAYAEAHGPASIVFCWHDLEQVVAIRPRRHWFGLQKRWLTLRDLTPQQ